MKYEFATMIVTNAVAVNLRKLSQMMDRSETDGMFTTGLSATGQLPATHWISSGQVPSAYVNAMTNDVRLFNIAQAAYAKEGVPFNFTQAQVTNALSKCTVSDGTTSVLVDGVPTTVPEGPHELLARLGLSLIGTTGPL